MAVEPNAKVVVDFLDIEDRRRPSRLNNVSPELIKLLRGTGDAKFLEQEEANHVDPLSVARGVKVAVLLSTFFWGLVIALLAGSLR